MRLQFILILLLAFTGNIAWASDPDTIHWSQNRHLIIADFKANVPANSQYSAQTNYEIDLDYKLSSDGTLSFSAQCVFFKKRSWLKKKIADSNILQHEQGHFDLAQAYTLKLMQQLKNYKPNKATIKKDMQDMYNKLVDEMEVTENLYDQETDHSKNTASQLQWDVKIQLMLSDYSVETLKTGAN